ncbi:MAG TPA: phosphoadenosine phosphosulfate reductase family protein, partial [Chthoniobacterales bacterium]
MSLLTQFSPAAIHEQAEKFETAHPLEMLQWAAEHFPERVGIGTSFQGAGLVIIDLAVQAGLKLPVFTLDTGLLFPETEALAVRLEDFFGIEIERVLPELTVAEQAA